MTKSRHNLTKSKILGNAASPNQTSKWMAFASFQFAIHFALAIQHSENLLCEIVAWINHQFVSKLEFRVLDLSWGIVSNLQDPARVFNHRHSLCMLFQCVLRRPELCYNFERPKILKFWEGCVHTSILTICICFSNCCFGILMSRSFPSNGVFDMLIRAVSVR